MHAPSGDIYQASAEDMEEAMRADNSSPNRSNFASIESNRQRLMDVIAEQNKLPSGELIPLSEEEHETIKNMEPVIRKGWMKNKPCVCGSGKKFKKCCWNSYHNKPVLIK